MIRCHRRSALRASLALLLLCSCLLPVAGCKRGKWKSFTAHFHRRKSTSQPNTTDYADNVQQVVSSPRLSMLHWANYTDYQAEVQQFYDDRTYELAWTRDGSPTKAAQQLMQMFADAAQKGLIPEDYDASRWAGRVAQLEKIRRTHEDSDEAQDAVAQYDAAMTISAMRYFADLHLGRVNPQALNFDIDVPSRRAQFDLPTLLNDQIVDSNDVPAEAAKVEPQNPMYKATEDALPRYLQLAQAQSENPLQPLPAVDKSVGVGESYPALPQLVARLQMESDAGAGLQPPNHYDQDVADAVKHYQDRNGLSADGKLTQATIDALNVPMSRRVQQLDDSLERWRWLPDNFQQPRVMVNLPEFFVRTYDEDHNLVFKMRVVDGEAKGNHDTPMFVRSMRYMVFRPYWNLPMSIVKKELMRHVNGTGGTAYLERNNYEVIDSSGKLVTGWTPGDLERGHYMVRQRPGPKNSLGLVKFMFPNEYDIYMHSTPEMNLFNLSRRDRSHGCIRLHDAEKMANWVLGGQGDWDEDKIHEAMYGPTDGSDPNNNRQVSLKSSLTVNITYLTANSDEDGSVHFFNDIYGYDQQLEQALAKGRPYEKTPVKINPRLTPGETE
jgi:L,D-transpeptidase YcbB